MYRDDVHDFCRDTGCHDPTKFEDLLFTLPVASHRAYFTDDAHLGTCFRDAVIGTHREGVKDKEVSDFILRGLEAKGQLHECPTDPDRTVLILQRRTRRLLNAEDLQAEAKRQGLFATVVEFDGMGVPDQIAAVRCCKLFVAVMGAGQQWVSFMRRGSTLLSIGWKNWKAEYYKKYAQEAGVHFLVALTDIVKPDFNNPTVKKVFGSKLKDASYRAQIVSSAHKQLAKNSDVELRFKDFNPALKSTFNGLKS